MILKKSDYNVKELVLDVHGCKRDLTCKKSAKQSVIVLRKAAEAVGATVRDIHCTKYTVHGFTTVALLAESHIILSAWPEFNYVSINIYLCNTKMDHQVVKQKIFDFLEPLSWRTSWFRHVTIPANYCRIFLAAPFSNYLHKNKFNPHAFEQITYFKKMLRQKGYNVFSAHEREDFGNKLMPPDTCTSLDFEEMSQCDVMVAIMSDDSYGVCVEIGWASALNKPIILVKPKHRQYPSPLIEGIGQVTAMTTVSNITEVFSVLKDYQGQEK
jgi:S-adenosylmethionine/arginine decarboxylase-like enzyme/nucleoside 2-deoxyribosyltransferase